MRQFAFVCGAATLLLAGCERTEPGAAIYFRTTPLTELREDSLEVAIAAAPYRVKDVATKRIPGGSTRGKVRLTPGADDSVRVDAFMAWLRGQQGIVAVGRDSAVVLR